MMFRSGSISSAALVLSSFFAIANTAPAQPAPPTNVRVMGAGAQNAPLQGRQWTVSDDGRYVTAENAVLRLKFGYNAQNYAGWFTGTSSGGGGRDGGIVELYYKPTSPTRNLIYRNGTWGSGYDNLDFFEIERVGGSGFMAPDYESGRHATMNSHSVTESAGRLLATFDFNFRNFHIVRTYTVYPWGDITVTCQITVTSTDTLYYFGHRFGFAASEDPIFNGATYNWGTQYENDGERYHAWSDGVASKGTNLGVKTESFYHYDKPFVMGQTAGFENSFTWEFGRNDQYSGFMMDDTDGDDPDIVVIAGDKSIYHSPYRSISTRMADGHPYAETAVATLDWAPTKVMIGQMTYFYMTCMNAAYPQAWTTALGTWKEVNHVVLRRGLGTSDYLPLWKARARDLEQGAPTAVSGASVQLNDNDRLYHLTATSGATTVRFQWTRPVVAANSIDYRTAFIVKGFDPSWVTVEGTGAPAINSYYDPNTHTTLLVLSGAQSGTPQPLTIALGK